MHSLLRNGLLALGLSCSLAAQAQQDSSADDLLRYADAPGRKYYTTGTFKTTRIVNAHSIENTAKGALDFRINHRFGRVDGGLKQFFGLDNAVTALEFDYGLTDRIEIGVLRSTLDKEYEGFVKAKLLRQTDDNSMPVSLSYVGTMSVTTDPPPLLDSGQKFNLSNRLYYSHQLLIARKFGSRFSAQLMPTFIHLNYVDHRSDPNNVGALGFGGKMRLSRRVTLNLEYFLLMPDNKFAGTVNSLSAGFDIETGGHVFQLHFTNSAAMTQRAFITQTFDQWTKGGIHFGFNISRVFTVVKPKGFENTRNKIY